jgi:hypothetical protein
MTVSAELASPFKALFEAIEREQERRGNLGEAGDVLRPAQARPLERVEQLDPG